MVGGKCMSEKILYSNPASIFVDSSNEEGFTYEPTGATPFCVRVSVKAYIPINVMVFADTGENAIKEVKKALQWMSDNYHRDYGDENKQHYAITTKAAFKKKMSEFLNEYTFSVQEVKMNQIFQIGWASNDTIR